MFCYLPSLAISELPPQWQSLFKAIIQEHAPGLNQRAVLELLWLWSVRKRLRSHFQDESLQLAALVPGTLLGGGVRVPRWLDVSLSVDQEDCWRLESRWQAEPGRIFIANSLPLLLECASALARYPQAHPLVFMLAATDQLREVRSLMDASSNAQRQAQMIAATTLSVVGCVGMPREGSDDAQHAHFEVLTTKTELAEELRSLDRDFLGTLEALPPEMIASPRAFLRTLGG